MTSKRIKANGTDTLQLGNGQLTIDQSTGAITAGPANQVGFKMTVGNGIANNNVAVLSNCRANADLDGRNFTNATGAGILLRARGGDTIGTTVTFLVAGYASGVDTDATEAGGILGNGTWHLGVGNDNFSKGTWYATNLAGSPSLVVQNSGAVGTLRQMIRFRLGSTTNDAASGTNCGGVQTTDASVSPSFYIGASDERLKEGIETAPAGALSRLSQIRLVDFWLKGGTDRPKTRGVIAQELQQVYPDHVYTNEDGYFGVSMGWDWELIQAIQELALLRSDDASRIAELSAKLDAAEARIKQLEDR